MTDRGRLAERIRIGVGAGRPDPGADRVSDGSGC